MGQTVVKRKSHAFLRFHKVPKVRINKGFSGLLQNHGYNRWARSQTTRATNCATPRYSVFPLNQASALPVATKALPSFAELTWHRQVAATRNGSLHPPPAAVAVSPPIAPHLAIQHGILYHIAHAMSIKRTIFLMAGIDVEKKFTITIYIPLEKNTKMV